METSRRNAIGELPPGLQHARKGRAAQVTRGSSKRQARRGAKLREQVLEAAIDCLAEMPYADVSTALIADRAGVSRGGMQYYFPTRLDLMSAAADYLNYLRLKLFRHDLEGLDRNSDVIRQIIESHWRHLHEREFRAYQELVLAGRSDPMLAKHLAATYGKFLEEWHRIARRLIGWQHDDPAVARSGNIAHYLLDGMAYGELGGQLDPASTRELLEFAMDIMRSVQPGA